MSLFRKNPNEVAYNGGKKHIIDRIENTGDGDLLFWRQPEEDFNTNSPLIVYQGTEAVFLENGRFVDVLGAGKHNLITDNIPFLSRFRNALSGGISTFPCRIYFVKTNVSKEINFGGRIKVNDPKYDVPLPIQYYGGYNVIIRNTGKFAEALVGDGQYRLERQGLDDWMRSRLSQSLNVSLRKVLRNSGEELIDACEQADIVAEKVAQEFAPELEKYGMEIEKLAFESLEVDENSIEYRQFADSKMARAGKKLDAMGDVDAYKQYAQVQEGLWEKFQGREILKDLANNPGAGGVASAGAGLGMGIAAGSMVGDIAKSVFSTMQQPQQPQQPVQQGGGNSRFGVAGTSPAATNPDDEMMNKLTKLKQMLDKGMITQEEFEGTKKQIMAKMFGL